MSRPGAIFDVDGTLVDSNYLHVLAWARAFHDHGHEVTMADLHRLIGRGGGDLVAEIVGSSDEAILDSHGEHYRSLRSDLRAFPQAGELLQAVADLGRTVVLASSAKPDDNDANLAMIDADDAIEEAVQAGDVDEAKPAADLFDLVVERADLDKERTVVIGDTVWDVLAAARAGLAAIGLTCGGIGGVQLRDAGAIAVYDDPAHLLAELDRSPLLLTRN